MDKKRLQQILDAFPQDGNVDALLERVRLVEKIEVGERQIEAGEIMSHRDAKKRFEQWLV